MDDSLFSDQPAPSADLFSEEPAPKEQGLLEAAGRGAANNVPMLPQAIAGLENGPYSKNLAEWNANAASAKAQHPVGYGAGAVAGTLAPLAIPGVGEAIEAAPVATGAALGAAGALSNEDLTKNPEELAKKGALGAVTGGALGKAGDVIGEKLAGLGEAAGEKSADVATRALGLSQKQLGRMAPEELSEYGQFAKANGLLDADAETALSNAQKAVAKHGAEIKASGATALPADSTEGTQALLEKATKLDGVKGAERDVRGYLNGAENLSTKGKTFGELQDLKDYYGKKAFDATHAVKDPVAADIYGQIKETMVNAINGSPAEYKAAMKNYKMALDAETGLEARLGSERAGNGAKGIGMMGRLVGSLPGQSSPAINIPTAATIAAMGHPYGALGAMTPSLTNPRVQSQTLDALAKALPGIPRAELIRTAEKLAGPLGLEGNQ